MKTEALADAGGLNLNAHKAKTWYILVSDLDHTMVRA